MQEWWVQIDLSCLGRTIYAWQFLGAKPLTQFRHRWAERNHSDDYTDSEPVSRLPNSLGPSAKLRTNVRVFCLWCHAIGERTPRADVLSTRLQGRSPTCYGVHFTREFTITWTIVYSRQFSTTANKLCPCWLTTKSITHLFLTSSKVALVTTPSSDSFLAVSVRKR